MYVYVCVYVCIYIYIYIYIDTLRDVRLGVRTRTVKESDLDKVCSSKGQNQKSQHTCADVYK